MHEGKSEKEREEGLAGFSTVRIGEKAVYLFKMLECAETFTICKKLNNEIYKVSSVAASLEQNV